MRADHLAKEADRLLADPVLKQAMADLRTDALESLVRQDAADVQGVTRLQARIWAIDEIREQLSAYIVALPDNPRPTV